MSAKPKVKVISSGDPDPFYTDRAERFGDAIAASLDGPKEARLVVVSSDELIGKFSDVVKNDTVFFGSVLPYRFCTSKSLIHPLISNRSVMPRGWKQGFANSIKNSTLQGYSAFSKRDLLRACDLLLNIAEIKSIRIKPGDETSGHGQVVTSEVSEINDYVNAIDENRILSCGFVAEENLGSDTRTLSVGTTAIGDTQMAYFGIQKRAYDCVGQLSYAGSDLYFCRGTLKNLWRLVQVKNVKTAIEQAIEVDDGFKAAFRDAYATRRNYDIIQEGEKHVYRSAVLEQSYRVGGATGAEIEAFKFMKENPKNDWCFASTNVSYHVEVPEVPKGQVAYENAKDPTASDGYHLGTAEPARTLTADEYESIRTKQDLLDEKRGVLNHIAL